jgi:cation-transporting ATPase 13A1
MLSLEGRSQAIFVITTIFLGFSFIAVCLRCFVRLRLVKAFGWDNALMVFAMVQIAVLWLFSMRICACCG